MLTELILEAGEPLQAAAEYLIAHECDAEYLARS